MHGDTIYYCKNLLFTPGIKNTNVIKYADAVFIVYINITKDDWIPTHTSFFALLSHVPFP